MGIKQAITRVLMDRLSPDEQAQMAADVVAWLCAELPQRERQEKIELLAPKLAKRIRAGQFGLRVVVCYHHLRLPLMRQLASRVRAVDAPLGSQPAWSAPEPLVGKSCSREA